MAHESITLHDLINTPERTNDAPHWERIEQLFRPGIRSWVRACFAKVADWSEPEVDALVSRLFSSVRAANPQPPEVSVEAFNTILTETFVSHLTSNPDIQQSDASDTTSLQTDGSSTSILQQPEGAAASDHLLNLLPRLPDAVRAVAAMRCIEGLKYSEIAERTGLEVGQAVRLHREAQSQLMQWLEVSRGVDSSPKGLEETRDEPGGSRH